MSQGSVWIRSLRTRTWRSLRTWTWRWPLAWTLRRAPGRLGRRALRRGGVFRRGSMLQFRVLCPSEERSEWHLPHTQLLGAALGWAPLRGAPLLVCGDQVAHWWPLRLEKACCRPEALLSGCVPLAVSGPLVSGSKHRSPVVRTVRDACFEHVLGTCMATCRMYGADSRAHVSLWRRRRPQGSASEKVRDPRCPRRRPRRRRTSRWRGLCWRCVPPRRACIVCRRILGAPHAGEQLLNHHSGEHESGKALLHRGRAPAQETTAVVGQCIQLRSRAHR